MYLLIKSRKINFVITLKKMLFSLFIKTQHAHTVIEHVVCNPDRLIFYVV